MSNISTESVYRVWNDREGVYLEVCDDPDGLGNVRVYTPNKLSKEWFGEFDFNISPKFAIELAKAITKAAEDRLKGNIS